MPKSWFCPKNRDFKPKIVIWAKKTQESLSLYVLCAYGHKWLCFFFLARATHPMAKSTKRNVYAQMHTTTNLLFVLMACVFMYKCAKKLSQLHAYRQDNFSPQRLHDKQINRQMHVNKMSLKFMSKCA